MADLDEMPDGDDDAVRAWAPSAAFRERGALIGVEALADEADRDGGGETMH